MMSWPWTVLRICATVTAVLVFDQAVFAGQFLAGSFGALHTHRENATYAGIAAVVTGAAALVVRLRAGGPVWPAYAWAGLFGLIAAQIALGFARLLTVHVPLGVAIIGATLWLTVWSWRAHPFRRPPPDPAPPSEEPAQPVPGITSARLPRESARPPREPSRPLDDGVLPLRGEERL